MKKCLFLFYFFFSFLSLSFFTTIAQETNDASKNLTTSSIAANREYRIGSGDILEIITWKEPDFSRSEILVRIDGKITFPLLNDIQAAYRTTSDLQKDITERMKAYVENPVVTITVKTTGSQKFYILGEVARTGEYNLTKDLTVLQAFAMAGGFTQWASKDEIILLRDEGDDERVISYKNPNTTKIDTILLQNKGSKDKLIRINYKNIIKGKDLSQNIKIKANDTIIVP